jgi:hypothetical protein
MTEEQFEAIMEHLGELKTMTLLHKINSDSLDPTELLDEALSFVNTVLDYAAGVEDQAIKPLTPTQEYV